VGKRLDSKLEATGAEFLVLGRLLIEKIAAYKTYTNDPGHDLVAVNGETNRSARIQVKSRWATDAYRGFLIGNFACDFVVYVRLNRGIRYRSTSQEDDKLDPEFYVLPVDVVQHAQIRTSRLGKVMARDIANFDSYQDNWELIRAFLMRQGSKIRKSD
jgi:hypothetical protein